MVHEIKSNFNHLYPSCRILFLNAVSKKIKLLLGFFLAYLMLKSVNPAAFGKSCTRKIRSIQEMRWQNENVCPMLEGVCGHLLSF